VSQYILINRVNVQNANAVSGLTWGFPSITHFLGFAHNLSRKLSMSNFSNFDLSGCGVISHQSHVHTYGVFNDRFLQNKTPPHLNAHDKTAAPPVIEEAKMNMTVSLLIGFDGFLGNKAASFTEWLKKQCLLQRLAGGTILDIESVQVFDVSDKNKFYLLKRKLLPGFALMDKSIYLEKHFESRLADDPETEVLDAWLDFSALKQGARPKYELISKHLKEQVENGELVDKTLQDWATHLNRIPYESNIPKSIFEYFQTLQQNKTNKAVLDQWQHYSEPTDKSPADWEFLPKPSAGYLVPIMTGYKAISDVYENEDVANTRDSETPVCFVEAVHSIGEWLGVNNFSDKYDIADCLWFYEYREHWYLCKQAHEGSETDQDENTIFTEILDLS